MSLLRTRTVLAFVSLTALLLTGCSSRYLVLSPAGPVGRQELDLIVLSVELLAVIVIPTLALLFYIVWRYRDRPGNTAPYEPTWADSRTLEAVWWAIPIIIVAVLGFYTAKTTFALVEPPQKDVKPITIQVISLNWKWLFQYPEQGIATVNYVKIPVGVPVDFELTADAPMNSFWVPQLGGQVYTMPGMAMRLWLQADRPGTYYGHAANFTGEGFAHMSFDVVATPQSDFDKWVASVKASSPPLTTAGYEQLKKPGVTSTAEFSSFPPDLFDRVVWTNGGRYMQGMTGHGMTDHDMTSHGMDGHDMTDHGTAAGETSR